MPVVLTRSRVNEASSGALRSRLPAITSRSLTAESSINLIGVIVTISIGVLALIIASLTYQHLQRSRQDLQEVASDITIEMNQSDPEAIEC